MQSKELSYSSIFYIGPAGGGGGGGGGLYSGNSPLLNWPHLTGWFLGGLGSDEYHYKFRHQCQGKSLT